MTFAATIVQKYAHHIDHYAGLATATLPKSIAIFALQLAAADLDEVWLDEASGFQHRIHNLQNNTADLVRQKRRSGRPLRGPERTTASRQNSQRRRTGRRQSRSPQMDAQKRTTNMKQLVAWTARKNSRPPTVHLVRNAQSTLTRCGRQISPATWKFAATTNITHNTHGPACAACVRISGRDEPGQ